MNGRKSRYCGIPATVPTEPDTRHLIHSGAHRPKPLRNGEAVMELFLFLLVFLLATGVAGQLGMIVTNSDPDVRQRSFIRQS
ncbi:hypothetical protein Cme02nite_26910 [Catellatospora methionotrophica]|uniref:Uncharacterized protein n=1 Tax=Catellatospora methionotrophica TaxID=121620 RepID=A0A8J3PF60_9ACTN|nr:hypothetical protein Cme02nite_26910 [Catellatospora methionotrophica]